MNKRNVITSLLIAASCAVLPYRLHADVGSNWICATSAAPWPGRGESVCESFLGSLWLMAGEGPGVLGDVWTSPNGSNWSQVTASAPWAARRAPATIVFQDKLWLMGGSLSGYPYTVTNDIWYTADGTNWVCTTRCAAWPARKNPLVVEMNGKLWLLNGHRNENAFDDVWSSVDGSNWVRETIAAPWGQRVSPTAAAFDGYIYIMGGYIGPVYQNDVWRSADGTNWTLVTSSVPFGTRAMCDTMMVFDHKMWLVGETVESGSTPTNDVWWTVNGSNWTRVAAAAAWQGRQAFARTVFANRMWIVGGRYSNDVWKSEEAADGLYAVVDVAAGPSATSYPVSYLSSQPILNDEYKTTKIVLRKIPAGTFVMGSPTNELGRDADETQHTVALSTPYYMGVFEITQAQYTNVMGGTNPSYFPGASRPVEQVSWDTVRGGTWPGGSSATGSFVGRMRIRTGLAIDLPTEAQWEYACRAGTTGAWNNGTTITNVDSDGTLSILGRYWYNGGYAYATNPVSGAHTTVGSYVVNNWGLYDMHGNVWEWCLDWNGVYTGDATDPAGAASGAYRVLRGSGWGQDSASSCRSASRGGTPPDPADNHFGFRLCMPAPERINLTNGLIAYYPFNGNANDESGNGHHGTDVGVQYQTSGACGRCAYFGGSSQYISIPHHADFALTNLTVAFWLKSPTAEMPGSYSRVLGKLKSDHPENPGASEGWEADMTTSNGVRIATGKNPNPGQELYVRHTGRDTWVHLTLLITPFGSTICTNGVHATTTNWATPSLVATDVPLMLGSYEAGGWSYMQGWLDEVKIWNRELLPQEIAANAALRHAAPDTPPSVSASDGTYTNKIAVTWAAASNATKYTVWRNTSSSTNTASNISADITANNYDDTTVTPGTTYWYWVKAGNADGWSGFSAGDGGYATISFETGTNWVCVTAGASWRQQQDLIPHAVFNGKMWVMCGLATDIWSSVDGTNWILQAHAPFGSRSYVTEGVAAFNNQLWLCGGMGDGGAEKNDVWSSSDGSNWALVGTAPWSARHDHSVTAYDGKLWVMGGYNGSFLRDVWCTSDGTNWTRATATAPWTGGDDGSVVVYDDKLWHLAGAPNHGVYANDVWHTVDGTNWIQATAAAPWSARHRLRTTVLNGRMWMMGGYEGSGNTYFGDIWSSADGTNWTKSTETSPWGARGGFGCLTFANRLWVIGGSTASSNTNDVWCSPPPAPEPLVLTNPPAATSGVSASDGTYTNKVAATWSPSPNATKYAVYRNTANNTNTAANISGDITATNYDDTTVTPGTTYWYWVKAGNAGGWSDFSAGDSGYALLILPPVPDIQPTYLDFSTNPAPRNITVANNGDGSFAFTNVVVSGGQWLTVLPLAGTVSSQAVPLVASVNRSSMPNGTYTGLVAVTPSVGSPVVVTCRMEVAGNSVVADAGGPYVANQGSPAMLDGSASMGIGLQYRWEVGDFITPYSTANVRYVFTGFVVDTNIVTLTVRDNRMPPATSSMSTYLVVRNVAPVVDAGGPYTGTVNRAMYFSAAIADPGTGDTHEVRWDFGSGWSVWQPASATNTSHTFSLGGEYVVRCEAEDTHGGIGADTATAIIDMPNVPPTARATLGPPHHDVVSNYLGMHLTVMLDGSGSADDRTATSNLFFDWREDVDNPSKPLLSGAARQQSNAVITFMPMPGTYKFHLVVNDGEYNSEPATVQANIPGLAGKVKSDGIGAVLPLYGVTLTTTNQAMGQVFSDTTDMEGKFVLDTGRGNGRAIVMDRNGLAHDALVNVDADGIRNYVLTFMPNVCSFTALVNSGYYGGAWAPIPGAFAQIIIGSEVGFTGAGDLSGQIPFGGVPELWPRNLPTVNYQVLYQKPGWESQVQALQPDPAVPAAHYPTLSLSDACTVHGIVVGTNNLPARDIAVQFGPAFGTVLTDADGRFVAGGVMRGVYFVKLSASDFDTTYTTVNVPPGDTNYVLPQPIYIRGGRFSVYGEVVNGENGMPIFNATARIVVSTNTKMHAMLSSTSSVASTRTGYYDLQVVKGARTMIVDAPGYEPKTIPIDAQGHVQQPVQLEPVVPEPAAAAGSLFVICYSFLVIRRKTNCRNSFSSRHVEPGLPGYSPQSLMRGGYGVHR